MKHIFPNKRRSSSFAFITSAQIVLLPSNECQFSFRMLFCYNFFPLDDDDDGGWKIDESLLLSARNHFYIENFLSKAFVICGRRKKPREARRMEIHVRHIFLVSFRDGTTQKPAVDNIAAIIFGSTPRRKEKLSNLE
jgi:hypothetical protein